MSSEQYSRHHHMASQALSILAMCHCRKGELEGARAKLQQASQMLDENLPKLATGELTQVANWLVADILYREAKSMLD